MFEFFEKHPVLRFFVDVIGLVIAASILVLIIGLILKWSDRLAYSNGFFLACVALAAIGSSRAILNRPALAKKAEENPLQENKSDPALTGLARILVRRSLNFRILLAAGICFLVSVLVAQ
jgi:hypothetical protein